jgi:hypothetical protein
MLPRNVLRRNAMTSHQLRHVVTDHIVSGET